MVVYDRKSKDVGLRGQKKGSKSGEPDRSVLGRHVYGNECGGAAVTSINCGCRSGLAESELRQRLRAIRTKCAKLCETFACLRTCLAAVLESRLLH
jgi:hypothetical protein